MRHSKLAKRLKTRAAKSQLVPIIIKKHPLTSAIGIATLGVASGIFLVYLKNNH